MNNSLLYFLYIQLMANLIESTGEIFDFRPSRIGYILHGFFEVPADNFAGNQFWLCFDFQTSTYNNETPKNGRYRRSLSNIDDDTFEDEISQELWSEISNEDYPVIECGGQPKHQGKNSYWFALNGLWLSENLLQLDFLNLKQRGHTLNLTRNVTFSNVNDDAVIPMELQQNMRFHWKFSVTFKNPSKSVAQLGRMDAFEIPSMKPDSQVQIRLNGYGARVESLLANINTIVIPYPTFLHL